MGMILTVGRGTIMTILVGLTIAFSAPVHAAEVTETNRCPDIFGKSYQDAIGDLFEGRVREGRAAISRIIGSSYGPLLTAVNKQVQMMSPEDLDKLYVNFTENFAVTPGLPRDSSLFRDLLADMKTQWSSDDFEFIKLMFYQYITPDSRVMSKLSENMKVSLGSSVETIGKFDQFAMAVGDEIRGTSGFLYAFPYLPSNVTAYGVEFTRRLIVTGLLLNLLFDSVDIPELSDEQIMVISHETARGREEISGQNIHVVIRTAYQEGILTILQTATLLMAQKLDRYPDPKLLLKRILTSKTSGGDGVLVNVALLSPAGLIGPLSMQGLFIPDMIEANEQGQIHLTDRARQSLIQMRQQGANRTAPTDGPVCFINSLYPKSYGVTETGQLGTGCPVASSQRSGNSALQKLADAFYRIFEYVDNHSRTRNGIPSFRRN